MYSSQGGCSFGGRLVVVIFVVVVVVSPVLTGSSLILSSHPTPPPRPTELWHSSTKFLVELVETLPLDDDYGAIPSRVDEASEDAEARFVDACIPKQFFAGVNGVSVAGLKHSDPSIVSDSLRILSAVLERSNKIISATVSSSSSSSRRDSLSRAIVKILPSPSILVASASFGSGNLALQARQDLPRTLDCLEQLVRALSG